MKRSTYIRWTLGTLFVAFFLTSCYTQLAVVKKKNVYVYEEERSRPAETYSDQDTVYYEDDQNWDDPNTHITNNYYDYPPPISWRARYYDPIFWDDYYFSSSYYDYGYEYYPVGYPYGYGWYRPVYIYDPYYSPGWGFRAGRGTNYKPRPFGRNGGMLRSGGNSTRISTRSRVGGSSSLVKHSATSGRRSIRKNDRSFGNAPDIQVVRGGSTGVGGRKTVTKSTPVKTVRKVVSNRKSRRSNRKYYPVNKRRRGTVKTVRSRKAVKVKSTKGIKKVKRSSQPTRIKRRSESSRSSGSRSSSRVSSQRSSTSHSSYSPPARSGNSRSSSRSSSSRSSRSSHRR